MLKIGKKYEKDMMFCEKYHAIIPIKTCLLRQKKAQRGKVFKVRKNFSDTDPGCADCKQGALILEKYNKKIYTKLPNKEPKKVLQFKK